MAMKILGLDLGGTNLHVGMLQGKEFRDLGQTPFKHKNNLKDEINELKKYIDTLEFKVDAITVASAGLLDSRRGVILKSFNFSGIEGKVSDALTQATGLPVFLLNDADAAALGTARHMALDNVCVLTLGTGVGSGVVVNGKVFLGGRGMGPDLGHLEISETKGPRKCSCGSYFCIESFWGKHGLLALVPWANSVKEITGSPRVEEATSNMLCNLMAKFIRNVCLSYNPTEIVFAGGIAPLLASWSKKFEGYLSAQFYGSLEALAPTVTYSPKVANPGAMGACYYGADCLEDLKS